MKIICLVFIVLLSTTESFAQSLTYKVTEIKMFNYSSSKDDFIPVDSTYPEGVYAYFDDNKISVNDQCHSNYYLSGRPEIKEYPTYVTSKWNANDESKNDCLVMFQIINPGDNESQVKLLYVMYKKVLLLYKINPVEKGLMSL